MVMFSVRNSQHEPMGEQETMQFLSKAREHGVLMGHIGQGKIRAVTHHGINDDRYQIGAYRDSTSVDRVTSVSIACSIISIPLSLAVENKRNFVLSKTKFRCYSL